MESLFLYVHIPFCLQKCTYCSFTTMGTDALDHEEYVSYIQKELFIRGHSLKNKTLKSIYFGGGTPSLLDVRLLEKIISSITHFFKTSHDIEITIEINPGTIHANKIDDYLLLGINRFSLGVQTFSDSLLQLCGREHSSEDSRKNMKEMHDKGLNFSCDLLFALPHQTVQMVKEDLTQMLAYHPPHISTYCLTIPSHHPLQKNRPMDSHQIDMFDVIETLLKKNRYVQYEISNFAKPSFISLHNEAYWNDKEFWGLGLSAHSYLKDGDYGVRFWNPRNMKKYKEQLLSNIKPPRPFSYLPRSQAEMLTKEQAISDFCHTALRTNKGCCRKKLVSKFGEKACFEVDKKLRTHIETGLVEEEANALILNFKGRMLSNEIFRSIV